MNNPNEKPKHTPGPWQCTKYPKVFSINAESGRQIAIMTEHHGDCPMVPMSQFERSEQDKADAALIAAAPDAYALILFIRDTWTMDDHSKALCDAYLAKARGES